MENKMTIYKNEKTSYLYDLKSREGMHLYYSVKERHGHFLEDRELFIQNTANLLKEEIEKYDFIVYPESSNLFLETLVAFFNIPSIKVYKNSIENILEKVDTLNLQKSEKESHLERIGNMNQSFKINSLKATQRRKYKELLFQETTIPEGNGVILDDSHFSGTTFDALIAVTGVKDCIAIFAK